MPGNSKSRQKGSTLTVRDEAMLSDLYQSRYMPTEYFAEMYFTSRSDPGEPEVASVSAANRRLQRLASHNWIVAHKNMMTPLGHSYKLWSLTESSFERQREILGDTTNTRVPGRPPVANLDHRIGIMRLYRDCAMPLRMLLDEPTLDTSETLTAWSWYAEGMIERTLQKSSGPKQLRPDAELHTPGLIFFIEYQTQESRISKQAMNDKISNYERYITHLLPEQTGAEPHLVVATDAEWVEEATNDRSRKLKFKAIGAAPDKAVSYIINVMSEKALSQSKE